MLETFISDVQKSFGSRIVCLLYYGSNAYNRRPSPFSDIDFYLLLGSREKKDLGHLRKICEQYFGIDITLQYQTELEAFNWNDFQLGNHGAFFILHLASARTLLGNNIFKNKHIQPSEKSKIRSLTFQIEEYFWRLEHMYFTELDTRKNIITYKKYLFRIAEDMMLIKSDITFRNINRYEHTEIFDKHIFGRPYFSIKTIKLFKEYAGSLDLYPYSKKVMNDLLVLSLHLRKDFLKLRETL